MKKCILRNLKLFFYNRNSISQDDACKLLKEGRDFTINIIKSLETKKRKVPHKKKPKNYKLFVEGEECKQVHLQDIVDPLGFSFYPIEVIEIRKNYLLGFEKSINKVHKLNSFFVLLDGKMVHKTIKDFIS